MNYIYRAINNCYHDFISFKIWEVFMKPFFYFYLTISRARIWDHSNIVQLVWMIGSQAKGHEFSLLWAKSSQLAIGWPIAMFFPEEDHFSDS